MKIHFRPGILTGLVPVLFMFLAAGCNDNEKAAGEDPVRQESSSPPTSDALGLLLDFDSDPLPATIETRSATTRVVARQGDSEGGALEVVFAPEVDRASVTFRPAQPWNWSQNSEFHMAIDATNTGAESAHLFLTIKDAQGSTARRSATIAPGESNTLFAILDGLAAEVDTGLRENPPPWESRDKMMIYSGRQDLDLSAVAEISLSMNGIIAEKRLVIDNIRLRANPDYDLSYLEDIVDEFGQSAKQEYPIKIHSVEELKQQANAELAALEQGGTLPDRSRFGGWKDGPKMDATGFFRTEKVNGKWWLVDPDGYLFFSNGLANVRIANLTTLTGIDFRDPSVRYVNPGEVTPEDSIGIVQVPDTARETRYVALPVRHNMFTWLPDYDDELANHYSFRRSAHSGPMNGGETFSFYRANLERRYGETEPDSFLRKWEEITLARMQDWGFTSMGNWVDPAFYPNEQVPYFANGWIIGDFKTLSTVLEVWAPMPDSFDPEFIRRAEITIKVIADEIQSSPWCVGVFVDNEKSWGLTEGTVPQRYGLILDALSRSSDESPAKNAFTQFLREKYTRVEALNQRWESNLESWDDLAAGIEFEQFTDDAVADFSTLLELLSDQYFRVVHDALEKYLPNHLYMGVRMAGWGMPAETIKAAVKYSDVLSFNIYEEGLLPEEWSFLDEIDLPSIIGEWHVGAISDTGLYHPGLIFASDQEDRARMWTAYMNSVLAQDTMVGAHWFQYVDSPITGRAFDGENYNVGFVSGTDIPYPEMIRAAREFNTALYPSRFGEEP